MSDKTERLVLLTSVPTEMQASIITSSLEQEGVRAVANGGFTAGFIAEAPGWVRILVAEKDLERGKELLETVSHEESDGEIDWSQVDVGEPEESEAGPEE